MRFLKTFLFWVLSCTWGILMTLFGGIVALALILSGHKPQRFRCYVCFEVGQNWGGMEAGAFMIVNKDASQTIKLHEAGHGLQNIMFGPLMPLIVSIPSAIRYWVRHFKKKKGLGSTLPPYDSIWFEGMATRLGTKYFNETKKKVKLRFVK